MASTCLKQAKDVMSRDLVTVHMENTIHEALQLMVENRVSALPVVDGKDHCVGVLSTTDIMELARDMDDDLSHMNDADIGMCIALIGRMSEGLGNDRVKSLMTNEVAAVNAETSLKSAAREMLRNRVHHLPVVESHNRLIGIVSTMDLLRAFAEEQ